MPDAVDDLEARIYLDQLAAELGKAARMEIRRSDRAHLNDEFTGRAIRTRADALFNAQSLLTHAFYAGQLESLSLQQARRLLDNLGVGATPPRSVADNPDPKIHPIPDANYIISGAQRREMTDINRVSLRGLVSNRPVAIHSASFGLDEIEAVHPDGPGARLQASSPYSGFKTIGVGFTRIPEYPGSPRDSSLVASERRFDAAISQMGKADGPRICLVILPTEPREDEYITGKREDSFTVSFEVIAPDSMHFKSYDNRDAFLWRGEAVLTSDQADVLTHIFNGEIVTSNRNSGPEAVAEFIDSIGERIFGHEHWHFGVDDKPPAGPQFWRWDPTSAKTQLATTRERVERKSFEDVETGRTNWRGKPITEPVERTEYEYKPRVEEPLPFPKMPRPSRDPERSFSRSTVPYPPNGGFADWRPYDKSEEELERAREDARVTGFRRLPPGHHERRVPGERARRPVSERQRGPRVRRAGDAPTRESRYEEPESSRPAPERTEMEREHRRGTQWSRERLVDRHNLDRDRGSTPRLLPPDRSGPGGR